MMKKKKLLVGIIPVVTIGILLCNKPISRIIEVKSNSYVAPANSAFTDENFYKCVVDAYNKENNTSLGYDVSLTDEQLYNITDLNCSGTFKSSNEEISDVNGLDKLKNLLQLNLDNNPITSIDLSENESIKTLSLIGNNNLNGIDLSKNIDLTELKIHSNGFSSIDLSKNTSLTYLDLKIGAPQDIDLSKNINLVHLYIDGQTLNNIDLSKNILLEELKINFRKLNNIDLSNNKKLVSVILNGMHSSNNNIENLNFSNNTKLTELTVYDISSLENLDLTKNVDLTKLNLSDNKLTSIDLSYNTKLVELNLNNNNISSIDLSNKPDLEKLYINNNILSNINVNNNTKLERIELANNQLSTIDLSNNVELTSLTLDDNKLSNLDVSNNKKLYVLGLNNNQLTNLDLSNNEELSSLSLNNNQLTNLDLSEHRHISNLYLNNNHLSSVSVFSGDSQSTVIDLRNLDLSNNNFNSEKYIYNKYDFSELPDIIVLPKKGYEFLSISNTELCTFEDNICIFNNSGVNSLVATYKTISEKKQEGYWSFPINYTFNVIKIDSNKYLIDDENNYIYTQFDTNNNVIMNNINLTDIDGVFSIIDNDKYIIKHNDDVIKEFDLINVSSNKYDLNQNFINITDNNIESLLNNINCTNCSTYVYDGTNNLTTGDFDDNYTLRIMYNDEVLKEFELKYSVVGVELNTNDLKLNLDTKKTYQLIFNVNPPYATNKNIIWESSNPSIATVDANGLVTAKGYGEATITVKTEDGEFADTCNVTVSEISTYTVTFKDGENAYTSDFEENEDVIFKTDLEKTGYKLVGWKYNNQDYKLTDKLSMPSNDIELDAIWELVIPEVKNYESDDNNITGISLKTNVNNLNLGIDSIYQVKISKHDGSDKTSGLIGTGDKVKIFLDNQLVSEYDVIIKGDVTGTGTSTVSDVAKLYQYLKGKVTMADCYIKAGNVVDSDSAIKVNDVAKLYQFIKGKINNL